MCVLGGTLHISLMSFFCSVASGLIYILLLFAVPHTVMLPILKVGIGVCMIEVSQCTSG